ncbi:IPT/TIG domain-containing protein, partial [Pontibacter sp. H259]|uniref:IPT/TIG domain-containing protein n=1 Tax=Pontibacter sp. H259 TaxID=3133421 RepID=UPI0030C44338
GAPVISSFSPASGPVGTEVIINGSNFTGINQIYVGNGLVSEFDVISTSQIRLKIPTSASTGLIQIRSTIGTAFSTTSFTVKGGPTVTSYSPKEGPIGTVVTITGTNFLTAKSVAIG